MKGFELGQMLLQGWPVLSILLIMSILSCTVIAERLIVLRRARLDARRFVAQVVRILQSQSVTNARDYCVRLRQPAAEAAAAILAAPDRASRERALQHTLQAQVRDLQAYVPLLGTIASSAPFVGLFGTVLGIIRAFADIASNIGGGPEVVAAGIAEALVTTAAGLLVAIPALMAYNYFVRQIERLAEEIDLASFELIELLSSDERSR